MQTYGPGEGIVANLHFTEISSGRDINSLENPSIKNLLIGRIGGEEIPFIVSNGDTEIIPVHFELAQNYPNPFNGSTTIRFTVPIMSNGDINTHKTRLMIYNSLGQEIRELFNDDYAPGHYSVIWDGKNSDGINLPSGIYIYSLEIGEDSYSRTMTYLK